MITPKEAAKAATAYAKQLYEAMDLPHLRLEEITLSEDGKLWNVTLGWVEQAVSTTSPLFSNYGGDIQKLPRVYKLFEVDAESGEVKAMRIRD